MTFPEPTFYSRTRCFLASSSLLWEECVQGSRMKMARSIVAKKKRFADQPLISFLFLSRENIRMRKGASSAQREKNLSFFAKRADFCGNGGGGRGGGLFLSCFSLPTLQWRRFRLHFSKIKKFFAVSGTVQEKVTPDFIIFENNNLLSYLPDKHFPLHTLALKIIFCTFSKK